jgi:hypothetical protein
MRLLRNLSWLILSISLFGCQTAPTSTQLLYCHKWSPSENAAIRGEITALPDDSALIPVLEDYKRVCANLG